jgi:hypothetical protein
MSTLCICFFATVIVCWQRCSHCASAVSSRTASTFAWCASSRCITCSSLYVFLPLSLLAALPQTGHSTASCRAASSFSHGARLSGSTSTLCSTHCSTLCWRRVMSMHDLQSYCCGPQYQTKISSCLIQMIECKISHFFDVLKPSR